VAAEPKFLIDPYLEWTKGEGIPIVEDFGVDLLEVETKPWARMEANGAIVHAKGRGDYLNVVVCEIPPGGAISPQRHLFEEVVYVLEGNGSTVIEGPRGERHSFEWGPHSLFALPLNARYRHYNGSGSTAARLASVTNLPMMLNAFHNERFIFENDFEFAERMGEEDHFRGEGNLVPIRPGKDMWETNFVPDLSSFNQLREWKARGGGGSHIKFILADGTMHAHISEMPVGIYKKGHRHSADYHIFPVVGHGYSLLWYEGDEEWERIDWEHGWVFAPGDQQYHQHFNTSGEPARYLAVAFGNVRYPFSEAKRKGFLGADVGVKEGGGQIDYEDEDPRIRRIFEKELAKNGVESRMEEMLAGARG
jgi:quercetin dioxygenase-like cupin family protein